MNNVLEGHFVVSNIVHIVSLYYLPCQKLNHHDSHLTNAALGKHECCALTKADKTVTMDGDDKAADGENLAK